MASLSSELIVRTAIARGDPGGGYRVHGHSHTPTYTSWRAMWARCTDPQASNYPAYGGRGIGVCARWRDFTRFLKDLGVRPDGATLDRIDGDGHYEPDNVRWASAAEQARNRRSTVWLTHAGRTMTTSDWARSLGLPATAVSRRLKSGWPAERALTPAPQEDTVCGRISVYYAKAKLNGTLDRRPGDRLPAYTSARDWAQTETVWGFTVAFGDGLVSNARSESFLTRPLFAPCAPAVVAATEFDEAGVTFAHADGRLLALAALVRQGLQGPELVLLTRPAYGLVAVAHPRMPVVLERDAVPSYLRDKRALALAEPALVRVR